MKQSPNLKKTIFRPWLWHQRLLDKLRVLPIPAELYLLNFFVQRILGHNNQVPWQMHYTSTLRGRVEIGVNSERSFAISGHCYFQGINGIKIGDNVIFAPGVQMISANHRQDRVGDSGHDYAPPIIIGDGVWIGANAVILPSVKIGNYAIIGAGSIVTKDIPDYGIAVGNPAKTIKFRQILKE